MKTGNTNSIEAIKNVTVLGAGTMGHGIAQVSAMAGFDVTLYDIAKEATEKGIAKIKSNLDKGVARAKVTAEQRDLTLANLEQNTDIESACKNANVVIEAAPESLDLKTKIYSDLDRFTSPSCLLATNTSSLSIRKIAQTIKDPSRVIGMHFFNPVHIMKLCEVVVHDKNTEESIELAMSLTKALGKTAIRVKDAPGFASSRLGLVIGLEAMRMFESGVASANDIDTAMKLGYGHPMGPLELTDLVGLDVRLSIANYLAKEIGPAFEPPEVLKEKVRRGLLGKKTGEGFFVWSDGKKQMES